MKKFLVVLIAILAFAGCGGGGNGDDNGNGDDSVEPTYFSVSFDPQNGTAVYSQLVEQGKYATKPADPTKTDFIFNSWRLNENLYYFNTPVTSSITLTAAWDAVPPNQYIVTFDTQGGSSIAPQTVIHGNVVTKPADPTRVSHTFNGWYLDNQTYDFSKPVTSSIVIKAEWLINQTNSIGMEFNYIPAGTFLMGTPPNDAGIDVWNEKPQHQVTITKAFYMGIHEVTQGQWKAVMGSNPSHFNETRLSIANSSDYPVEMVNRNDVQNFITALNTLESGVTYRLPTEAEWEYAARAGSNTIYPGGDTSANLGNYAWYSDNSDNRTHQVGQKQPNA